jgi:ABC-type glycerol-3-phosphate transport system permease component
MTSRVKPRRLQADRSSRQYGLKTTLAILVLVSIAPYLFMMTTSLKTNQQFDDSFWSLPIPAHFENYLRAGQQIAPYLMNSIIVAVASVVLIAAIASISGFVLARYRFLGKRVIYAAVIILMTVPALGTLIPLFVLVKDLGLLNTYLALVIPYTTGGAVLGTVLVRNFVQSMPQSILDAARVDGANGLRLYRSIMLPLSLPVLGSISLVTVSAIWNDFFWPLLVITDNNLRTVSVGVQFFQGQNTVDYGPLMAGYLLASVPLLVLFVLLSRYFLAGIQGGVPGAH